MAFSTATTKDGHAKQLRGSIERDFLFKWTRACEQRLSFLVTVARQVLDREKEIGNLPQYPVVEDEPAWQAGSAPGMTIPEYKEWRAAYYSSNAQSEHPTGTPD